MGLKFQAKDFTAKKVEAGRVRKILAKAAEKELANVMKDCKNPERKAEAGNSFKRFCEIYFPNLFYLEWSTIHLKVISVIEEVILKGNLFALAMPRGSGKTTLCTLAVLWAILYGYRKFAVLIATNGVRANALVDDILSILFTNELLLEDFPEVCIPVRESGLNSRRASTQLYNGENAGLDFKAGFIKFPHIGLLSADAAIQGCGLSGGSLRGLGYIKPNGERQRPDLVLLDDPQDRESAQSATQTALREQTIKADVLGMAGPGKTIACLITSTVICQDDLAERLLDRDRNPDFRGIKYKLLDSMPDNMEMWNEYNEIRSNEIKNDGDGSVATEFYRKNFNEMNKGAVCTWQQRHNENQIDGLQFAMDLFFRDEQAFLSEYQNDPASTFSYDLDFTPEKCQAACCGTRRNEVPDGTDFITAFIDVHKGLLYYSVCAWNSDFSGTIIDYGSYPKQTKNNFQLSNAYYTLGRMYKNQPLEVILYKGLDDLCNQILTRTYKTSGGELIPVKRILIDANWGPQTDTVYKFISESKFRAQITPSHGRFIGAGGKQFGEGFEQTGDKIGVHWRIPKKTQRFGTRYCLFDSNYWKTFLFNRLNAGVGEPGRLKLFGKPNEHALLSDHLGSEYCTSVESYGRRVDEWKLKKSGIDNHLLDCLSGTCVAASIEGASLVVGQKVGKKISRRHASYLRMVSGK